MSESDSQQRQLRRLWSSFLPFGWVLHPTRESCRQLSLVRHLTQTPVDLCLAVTGRIRDCAPRTTHHAPQTTDYGLRIADCGPRTTNGDSRLSLSLSLSRLMKRTYHVSFLTLPILKFVHHPRSVHGSDTSRDSPASHSFTSGSIYVVQSRGHRTRDWLSDYRSHSVVSARLPPHRLLIVVPPFLDRHLLLICASVLVTHTSATSRRLSSFALCTVYNRTHRRTTSSLPLSTVLETGSVPRCRYRQ